MVERAPTQKDVKRIDKDLEEGRALRDETTDRNTRDGVSQRTFVDGTFSGELWKSMDTEVPSAKDQKLLVNFFRTQVTDRATLLTMLPDQKWDVPFDYTDDSLTYQQVLSQLNLTFWEHWKMRKLRNDIAFWMSLKGRVALQLVPDFQREIPMLYAFDPSYFYAVMDGTDEIQRCWIIYMLPGRQILAQYPNAEFTNEGVEFNNTLHEVVLFWDKKVKKNFVGSSLIPESHFQHNLGYVPFQYPQDIHVPGTIDATTAAHQAIGLAENFTDLLLMSSEERRRRIKAIPWVKGMRNADEETLRKILAGEVFAELDDDGALGFESPITNMSDITRDMQLNEDLFRAATNFPRSRSGEITSSIWTGKSIEASQGAVSDDILRVREAIADSIQWMDEKAIGMLKRFWGDKELNILDFTDQQRIKGLNIIPNEDIPDTWRHELVVFSLAHDVSQKAILMIQLGNSGYLDKRTVIEQLPGFNPNEILRRMEEERIREAEWEIAVQAKLAEATQPQPEAPGAGEENFALEQGAIPTPENNLTSGGLVPSPGPANVGFTPNAPGVV